MATSIGIVKKYLDDIDFNYEMKDEDTIITGYSSDDNKIMIIIRLMENGEFIQLRTLKHLDELVEEASEEKRVALMKWMLKQNYTTKSGAWEYDPDDHDHHFSIGHVIEDSELTQTQFMRMMKIMTGTADLIPEMKSVLGIQSAAVDPVEAKRQELLAQLRALDDGAGI